MAIPGFLCRLGMLPWRSIASDAVSGSFFVAKMMCFAHVVNAHLCTVVLAVGPSMMPTINPNGEFVVLDKVTARWGTIKKGDVVVVRSPEKPSKIMTKRVYAEEGDVVTYLVDPEKGAETKTVLVPKGHVWVQGDNIYASRDSRKFGPVSRGLIEGKVIYTIWPPEHARSINMRV